MLPSRNQDGLAEGDGAQILTPEMSGSVSASRARSSPAMVPAKASGNQASGHRGRCQAPSSSRVVKSIVLGTRSGQPGQPMVPIASPSVPSNRQRIAISAPAPSRAGPLQTSSHPDARAPEPYSRM